MRVLELDARYEPEDQPRSISPWEFDLIALETMVQRWGTKAVLEQVATIHKRSHRGSEVRWSVLSQAYLMAGYDSPNDCDC
ncbi:MAG: hypothetical protein LVS60_03345 [Nodosilinea sp. LVE1205-7]|jgi:hypothetical protein